MRYELGGLEKHMTSSPWCNVALLLQPMAAITTGSEELFFVGRPTEEEPVSNLQKVVEYARELLEAVAKQNATIETLRHTIEHLENRLGRMAMKVAALEAIEATKTQPRTPSLERRGGPELENPLRRIEEGIQRLEDQFRIPPLEVGTSWGTTSIGITSGSRTGDTITYTNDPRTFTIDPRTFTTAPALIDPLTIMRMRSAAEIDPSIWDAGGLISGATQSVQENLSRGLGEYMVREVDRQILEGTTGDSG